MGSNKQLEIVKNVLKISVLVRQALLKILILFYQEPRLHVGETGTERRV